VIYSIYSGHDSYIQRIALYKFLAATHPVNVFEAIAFSRSWLECLLYLESKSAIQI